MRAMTNSWNAKNNIKMTEQSLECVIKSKFDKTVLSRNSVFEISKTQKWQKYPHGNEF